MEAFIGPAERVGRDDHVFHAKQRIRRVHRLLLEDIQARAGDPAGAQRSMSAASSTIGPRATFMK